jgi:pimeloyl-ACP methyl ester carboxylesterase
MSSYSHETAPTRFVEADGFRFAYRRFGKRGALPLLFLQYFNANLDDWDPFVTNGLALDRDVILFDNAGVGSSGGDEPSTVLEMARHVVAFRRALELKEIDA